VTDGATPEVRRDAAGIALGGLRTPPVDVLSGAPGASTDVICLLLGSTRQSPRRRWRFGARRRNWPMSPPGQGC